MLTVQTNIPTGTGANTTANKLEQVKSCQAEHRVKIRHPCPPSQHEDVVVKPGAISQRKIEWQLIVGEDV